MSDYIKELPVKQKTKEGIRKFEISCPNYEVRKRLSPDDYCHNCRKEKQPKTVFVFSGNPPYKPIENDDTFRCGQRFVFGFDAAGKGNPYLTKTGSSDSRESIIFGLERNEFSYMC